MARQPNQIDFFSQFTPPGAGTGEPERLQSLANVFGSIRNMATQELAVASQAKGRKEAIRDVEAGVVEERSPFTVRGQAYNQAAILGHRARVRRDTRETLTRLERDYGDDPEAFRNAADGFKQGIVENMPEDMAFPIGQDIDDAISSVGIRLEDEFIRRQEQENLAAVQDEIGAMTDEVLNAAADGQADRVVELSTQLEALQTGAVEFGLIDQRTARAQREALGKAVTQNAIRGQILREFDPQDPEASLVALDDLKRPRNLNQDEFEDFVRETQTEINRKIARQRKIEKATRAEIAQAASVERGRLFATDPNIPPAPFGQDKKDVDNYFESIASDLANMPASEAETTVLDIVQNSGVVPEGLNRTVSASMRSGNPEQVLAMSNMIIKIQDKTPEAISDVNSESRTMALQVTDAMRAGVDPEQAVEAARKNVYGTTGAEREVIKEQTKDAVERLPKTLREFSTRSPREGGYDEGIMGGLFNIVPQIPPAMEADYRIAFDSFITTTGGNIPQAEQLAFQTVRGNWGVTDTGGDRRFMKRSPENVYGIPGVDNDWISDQFEEEMAAAGYEGAQIAFDRQVARQERPEYPVMVPNEDGVMEPAVNEIGDRITWSPDFKLTEQYKELQGIPAEQEAKIETARERRERKMKIRANQIVRKVRKLIHLDTRLLGHRLTEYMATEEGRQNVERTLGNLRAAGKIDAIEYKQAREGFGLDGGISTEEMQEINQEGVPVEERRLDELDPEVRDRVEQAIREGASIEDVQNILDRLT